MYAKYFKRVIDFTLALIALIVLSPLFIILTIAGAVAMGGNPFFVQERPGKDEKIFSLIKFRTMNNKRGEDGELLPDTVRLNKYGRFLRSTSCDELPSLVNVLMGDLSLIGPRPLAVQYLPFFTETERKRHSVRPGLTGLAQANGRNGLSWDKKFEYDIAYVENLTFAMDAKIFLKTIKVVLTRQNIGIRGEDGLIDFDVYRKRRWEDANVN
ncbi:MAG: sugar transferase [Monoglobales bacterium]